MFETLVNDRKRTTKHPKDDPRLLTIEQIAALPFPPERHERGRFYLVLSEFHETTFPGRPYNFQRINNRGTAVAVARNLARRVKGEPFHVLEHVGGFVVKNDRMETFAGVEHEPESADDVVIGRGFGTRRERIYDFPLWPYDSEDM